MQIHGVMVGLSLCALLFASMCVSLFMVILVWAQTLWMEILCGIQYILVCHCRYE